MMIKTILWLVAVWAVIALSAYGTAWILTHQPVIKQLRDFTLQEQAKIHLYEQVGYDYKLFRQLNDVAYCESRWKLDAFNSRTFDYGTFQINEIHLPEAEAKGYDVKNDWKDNIDFAVNELHARSGLRPWYPSKHCWSKLIALHSKYP